MRSVGAGVGAGGALGAEGELTHEGIEVDEAVAVLTVVAHREQQAEQQQQQADARGDADDCRGADGPNGEVACIRGKQLGGRWKHLLASTAVQGNPVLAEHDNGIMSKERHKPAAPDPVVPPRLHSAPKGDFHGWNPSHPQCEHVVLLMS